MVAAEILSNKVLMRPAEGAGILSPAGSSQPSDSRGLEEVKLLEGLRRGDRASFEKLAGQYSDAILAVAYRFLRNEAEACDASQEALVRALQSIHEYHEESPLSTWLHQIIVTEVLKRFQVASCCPELGLPHLLPSFNDQGGHAQPVKPLSIAFPSAASRDKIQSQARMCMEQLPLQYRAVLILRDIEKLSTWETAKVLGIDEGTIKMRLNDARLAMARLLVSAQNGATRDTHVS